MLDLADKVTQVRDVADALQDRITRGAAPRSVFVDDELYTCQPEVEVRRPARCDSALLHYVEAHGVGKREVLI